MSKELQDYQQQIAFLEESNRNLRQQLAESQQSCHHTVQELQKARKTLQNLQTFQSKSQQFLHLAVNNLPGAIFWKDLNSVYLGCNEYFANLAGLNSSTEIVGKTDYELPWKREETEWYRQCDRRVMDSNTPELGIIEPQQQADGSQCWLETNKIPLHDESGNVIGILGTFIEVTERIQAETNLKHLNEKLEQRIAERTEKLRTTEARLQRLADNLPGLIFQFRLEADGTRSFPYVSQGSRDIYELEPENFLQVFNFVHDQDRNSLEQTIQESARSLTGFHHEHRVILPTGVVKWVQVISRPELQKDHAIVWDGLIIEISDRKAAEQELQQQKQLLRSIYDGVTHPIFVIDILDNGDFRHISFNRATEEITGKSNAEIFNKTSEEIFPPEQAHHMRQNYHNCLEAGTAIAYEECLNFQGQKTWFLTTLNPIKDTTGKIIRLVGTALDISARKASEQALRESETKYQQILDAITDMVLVKGEKSSIVWANQAFRAYYGMSNEDLQDIIGDSFNDPDYTQQYIRDDAYVFETGQTLEVEESITRHDGEVRQFSTIKSAIRNEEGQIILTVGVSRDISERVKLETERKRQAQVLRFIVEGTASQTGEDFFRACVKSLAIALDIRYALIAELESHETGQVANTLAFWGGEDFGENFEYNLTGTPCFHIFQSKNLCCYSHDIQAQFPEDSDLVDLDAESYLGTPVLDLQGNCLGLLALLDTKPMERDLEMESSILKIFAARVGAEILRMHTEKALREKDTLLQMTLTAGKMGCWRWNLNTSGITWSDGIEEILGLEPGSFGETFEDYIALIHREDQDQVMQTIEQTLETEQEYNIEHRIVLSHGEIRWIRGTGKIWRNERGEAVGLMGSIMDDTLRKENEIALIESAQQIHQQAQQEQLLNQIANEIRTSLDLDHILNTTVQEIVNFLRVDRCHFAWYIQEGNEAYWDVITEVQNPGLPSFVGKYSVANFGVLSETLLRQQIVRIDDVSTVKNSAVREVLIALGNTSMLVLPVSAESGKFGIVSCIHSQSVRPWDDDEVEFLEAVMGQLAIALNQADLLAQSQGRAQELEDLLNQLQRTQTQLIQSEKMSSLGQLVAGVAHEINNPVSFIHGNITYAKEYTQDLIELLELYQCHHPQPHPEIHEAIEKIDLEFLKEDVKKLFQSMKVGTDRISEIVKSLRTFSRLDESEIKQVNLHEGIESTLTILNTRLREQNWRPAIQVIKEYKDLPTIECYAGQINQVFMNILNNAIDALEERDYERSRSQIQEHPSQIRIQTLTVSKSIVIRITDNGLGINPDTQDKLFDPFFTTKAIGKGTGLGLSISYQIITEKHQGHLSCTSHPGETTFIIEIPIQRQKSEP